MVVCISKEGNMNKAESAIKADNMDRRVRKTRTALKQALTTLLQEKNVKDISVKDLTELADVNRGTFYLHYKDVFDLMEQCELDLLGEFESVFKGVSGQEFLNRPGDVFERIYSMCKDNADFVRVLLGENGDIKFLNSMTSFLKERCLHDWGEVIKEVDSTQFDAYYTFLVGGCVSLLQYWFNTGMKKSPKELANITVDFLIRSTAGGTVHSGKSKD